MINVSRQTISSWETGRNSPDIETLVKLADIYQISLEQILFDKKQPMKIYSNGLKSILAIVSSILLVERITQLSTVNARLWMDFMLLIPIALLLIVFLVNKNIINPNIGAPVIIISMSLFGAIGIISSVINLFSMGLGFQITCFVCGSIVIVYLLYIRKNQIKILIMKLKKR